MNWQKKLDYRNCPTGTYLPDIYLYPTQLDSIFEKKMGNKLPEISGLSQYFG